MKKEWTHMRPFFFHISKYHQVFVCNPDYAIRSPGVFKRGVCGGSLL